MVFEKIDTKNSVNKKYNYKQLTDYNSVYLVKTALQEQSDKGIHCFFKYLGPDNIWSI